MDWTTLNRLMYRATGAIVYGDRLVYAPRKQRVHSRPINDLALAAFGDVAIAREREACAKLCDEAESRFEELWSKFAYPTDQGAAEASRQLSAAIRARGQK